MLRSSILLKMSEDLARNKFRYKQLQELDTEVEWKTLVDIINPHYLATSIGKHLIPAETMLRIFFLQIRYDISSSGLEDALFQIEALRDFALIDIDKDIIPSKVYIDSFNQLISEQSLTSVFLEHLNLDSAKKK